MSKFGNSSFWLGDWGNDDIVTSTMTEVERHSHDIYKLASTKRAISNFVNIVTNKNIPVVFRENGDSYTDGKHVVIGANVVKPKDFDVCVGLALHEGSHIILSDFDILKKLPHLLPLDVKNRAEKKGIDFSQLTSSVKNVWNYVEDRRIDNYIYRSAPGYRDYYRAMYDKYFNDHIISKALRSNEMTEESLESYMFRLINLHSDDARMDALKGLPEIYKTIDLPNISRLNSSSDTLSVAFDVFRVILNNLPDATSQSQSNEGDSSEDGEEGEQSENGEGSSSQMTGESSDESSMGDSPSNDSEMDSDGNSESSDEGSSSSSSSESSSSQSSSSSSSSNQTDSNPGSSSGSTPNDSGSDEVPELTERQKKLLPKRIEKQEKFLDGEVQKTGVSSKEKNEVDAIEESGSEMKTVGDNVESEYRWRNSQKGIDCIIVNKMTKSLMESSVFPMSHTGYGSDGLINYNEEAVAKGIRIGSVLGKKLQVRGEERNTIYNRQKSGRIDKRMVASLGYGNENVFQYTDVDFYKQANLHVSIDASGSMSGRKWEETIVNVVALCKAVDMIENLDIQVTFRTTTNSKPYVVKAYDSREDKFMKVQQLFPHLHTAGTTPEGLCFEAIMDEFMPVSTEWDSYFLNISDGMPYFGNGDYSYSGDGARKHTRKMVTNILKKGIKVLSYFVDDSSYSDDQPSSEFVEMYGKSAKKIDVTNVRQITKTMNDLFLEK